MSRIFTDFCRADYERLLDDFLFLPLTIGRSLHIHPVLSVLMLFLGATVAGPTGLVLVLPVLGVVTVITETLGQIVSDRCLRERFRQARLLKASPQPVVAVWPDRADL